MNEVYYKAPFITFYYLLIASRLEQKLGSLGHNRRFLLSLDCFRLRHQRVSSNARAETFYYLLIASFCKRRRHVRSTVLLSTIS